ncbi:hypothetical protein EV649_5076 [Kribbella sp. VKM Ac-2569]|uniref:hypothetical protein n=1 Tax=Kribbella sp. VKM Ac-2569 TaxID=2512220 RepID=UPI00102C0FC2|nr:hypothetical protein [Kribbella sp. VKM Ac-2569]RZT17529.1 hypothetical protein EV649_5076 [Kribbella sp. VKM Ac-2569]
MTTPGFVLRAPWYFRERERLDLRTPRSRRPQLQMYDSSTFGEQITRDPADSVKFGADDVWSYPIPVVPDLTDKSRLRLATSALVTTNLRKLYQPMHQRFYAVVVEVFCDSPGLPRAGEHDDIGVEFRMRRMHTTVTGKRRPTRRVATALVAELAKAQGRKIADTDPDLRDLWWADVAWRRRFEEDQKEQLAQLDAHTEYQQWLVAKKTGTGRWRTLDDDLDPVLEDEDEEMHPMWRLPQRDRDKNCDAARTRSLWFGIVPTFSGDHWKGRTPRGEPTTEPKLDDHAIYEIECVVSQPHPTRPTECSPRTWVSTPTEPFRLATHMDPDGTKNRTVTVTLPDLRNLAARAGQKQGPGGVRVVTPPRSQMVFNPFNGVPKSGSGRIGAGDGICTFALELFFLVAFFLFLMFLPIVVLAFQLWWMLALRFCIPPSIGFAATADFLATGKLITDLDTGMKVELDIAMGMDTSSLTGDDKTKGWTHQLTEATDPLSTPPNKPVFKTDSNLTHALVIATDPTDAQPPAPLPREKSPDDPLCPVTPRP